MQRAIANQELGEEAFNEAIKRYPDSFAAIIFLKVALGYAFAEPTEADIEWARQQLSSRCS